MKANKSILRTFFLEPFIYTVSLIICFAASFITSIWYYFKIVMASMDQTGVLLGVNYNIWPAVPLSKPGRKIRPILFLIVMCFSLIIISVQCVMHYLQIVCKSAMALHFEVIGRLGIIPSSKEVNHAKKPRS